MNQLWRYFKIGIYFGLINLVLGFILMIMLPILGIAGYSALSTIFSKGISAVVVIIILISGLFILDGYIITRLAREVR